MKQVDVGHKVDRDRWSKFNINEQTGNIGSEVGRSLKFKRHGDPKSAEAAFIRALDLFDATAQDIKTKHEVKKRVELIRAKKQFVAAYSSGLETEGIENYFMKYAAAARLSR